ncbi:MAG: MFS transporter, partial [Tepidimonas ignava]
VLCGVAKDEMVQALALITLAAPMGPALGPLVGATVTQTSGWRWIFLFNLPVGLITIALALAPIPRELVAPLDRTGFVLSAFGLGAGLLGLSCLGEHLVSNPVALGAMAAGLAVLAICTIRARGRSDALVDPLLCRHHTFTVGIVLGTLFRMSGGAATFFFPLLFQIGLGLSMPVSGLLSGLFALGGLTMRALAPRILDSFDFR